MNDPQPNHPTPSAPLISIIVPVYGAEALLPRCIDSLLRQDYPSFEIILVEDGSPDNCAAICDRYAAADPRIRAYHQPNAGASAARNKGMELAQGDYLCFVDADDYVDEHYLSHFAEGLGPEVDLVFQGITEVRSNKPKELLPPHRLYTADDLLSGVAEIHERHPFLFGYVCTKLYRKSIIHSNSLHFRQDISLSEDRIFALEYMQHVRMMNCIAHSSYFYEIQSTGLTMRRRNYAELKHAADVNLEKAQLLLQQNENPRFEAITRQNYIMSAMSFLTALFLRPTPWRDIHRAIRQFQQDFSLWLSLYSPSTTDQKALYRALLCQPTTCILLMKLYWFMKRTKHRLARHPLN